MKNLSLFITQVCDKNCYYCDVPAIEKPKHLNMELYRKLCEYIKDHDFDYLSLSGGEPGTLSVEYLDEIFKLSPFKIKVNTNGLFIRKMFHERFKDKIDHICYHLTKKDEKVDWKPTGKDYFVYVVTLFNACNIPKLKSRYKNIIFKMADIKKNNLDFSLTPNQVSKYKDYLFEVDYYGLESKECNVADRQIDLIEGRILKCCKSYTHSPSLEFNKKNLRKILEDRQCELWNACKNCLKPWSGY